MGREQDLSAWRLFVTTIDAGSVNAACDKLQMDPSTASRILKALERDLGVEIFNRTTRPVSLSGVGYAIAEEARLMLQQHDRLLSHLHEDRQTMKGTIRIASYSALSAIEIMPLLFVPAGAGLIDAWDVLKPMFVPLLVIMVVSTLIVMVVSGHVTQFLMRRKNREDKRQ